VFEPLSRGVLRDGDTEVAAESPVDRRSLVFAVALHGQSANQDKATTVLQLIGDLPEHSGKLSNREILPSHLKERLAR
jgi:hypothetical protein